MADVPRQPALPVVRLAAAVMTACKVSAVVVALGAMALHIATWGRDSWAATLGAGSVGAAAWVGVAMLRGARPGTLRELRRAVLRAAVVRSVLGLVLAVCAWLVFRPEPAPLVGAFVLAAVWCVAIEAGYLMVVRRRGPG